MRSMVTLTLADLSVKKNSVIFFTSLLMVKGYFYGLRLNWSEFKFDINVSCTYEKIFYLLFSFFIIL